MTVDRKKSRFHAYVKKHKSYFGTPLTGPMLEYGCGAGGFLIEAHANNIACHGVEVVEMRQKQFRDKIAAEKKAHLDDFFHLYGGEILPFNTGYFNAVYSWFVMEHVGHVWTSLREIVRVLKPGGTIFIATQDARNCYEGHADKPWPPFLPLSLIPPYLDELGYEPDYIEYVCQEVFYVTAPQMTSTLRALGCEIIYESADPDPTYLEAINIQTDAEIRAFARRVKTLIETNAWERPKENAIIYARKLT